MASTDARMQTLLQEAARSLLRAENPFHTTFLQAHTVTAEEAYSYTSQVGAILQGYLLAPPRLQALLILLGTARDQQIPEPIIAEAVRLLASDNLVEQVAGILRDVAQRRQA